MLLELNSDRRRYFLLWSLIVIVSQVSIVKSGCREQENKCDPVCVYNSKNELECNLRSVLIFTNSTDFEANLEVVR